MSDLIKREDAIEAIHNYWEKRLDTLPTTTCEYGEVYADIQQIDKILEHNKTLCNFIRSIPSAERKGEWETVGKTHPYVRCSLCGRVRVSYSSRFCDWCGAKMGGAEDE